MRLRLVASALVLGLTLSACSGDKSAGTGGGTVIAGMGNDPSSLFPLLAEEETSFAVSSMLFERLAARDEKKS